MSVLEEHVTKIVNDLMDGIRKAPVTKEYPFDISFLEELELIQFANSSFLISKTINYHLDIWYGNGKWMEEYPEDQRGPSHTDYSNSIIL